MSITASELIVYGSLNMPEDDSSLSGGIIDTTTRIVFDSPSLANTLNDKVKAVSSSATDLSTLVVTGRLSTGVVSSDTITLLGTNTASGTVTFERILKMVAAAHTGTITVKDFTTNTTTIAAIESGVLTVRRPFYNAAANAVGGDTKTFYEKVFFKNTNSSLALTSCGIVEVTGGLASTTTFALASGNNDGSSATNRLTAPTGGFGVTSFDSAVKLHPSGYLDVGQAIGVWMALAITGGSPAQKSTYTLQISGLTT